MSATSEVNQTSPPTAKRRRIALACVDCRRRKLKCDRIFPACGRCQKAGVSDRCTYDPDAIVTSSEDAPTGVASVGAQPERPVVASTGKHITTHASLFEQLENRIVGLERLTNGNAQSGPLGRDQQFGYSNAFNDLDDRPDDNEEILMFRGKSFKTSFYGASHPPSYLSQLPELRIFMKEMIVQHPGTQQLHKELKKGKGESQTENIGPPTDELLTSIVFAKKDLADLLVQNYISHFETTYRVLHLPSFWEEYQRLGNAQDKPNPSFICLVLLMMAATNHVRTEDLSIFKGPSSFAREEANIWIEKCEAWLGLQSQKHMTMLQVQAHCVLCIAKQINMYKHKRTWTATGALIHWATSIGLHRNIDLLHHQRDNSGKKKMSLFDQEMRRRLWWTIAELDLQSAIDRGMPPSIPNLIVDCGSPLNCDDEDIHPEMNQWPETYPVSHFTRSAWLKYMAITFKLRQDLVTFINGTSEHSGHWSVELQRRVDRMFGQAPTWNTPSSELADTLLTLRIEQATSLLHHQVVHNGDGPYRSSLVVLSDAVTNTIDIHHQLLTTGNFVWGLLGNDILSAALGMTYICTKTGRREVYKNTTSSSFISLADAIACLERALAILEHRIMHLGVGFQAYYAVCAAQGLLKKHSPTAGQSEEYQAAEKIAGLMRRVLSREDKYSVAATLASLPNTSASANQTVNGFNGVLPQPPFQLDGTQPFTDVSQFGNFDFDMDTWDFEPLFSF